MSLSSIINTIFGDKSTGDLKALRPVLEKIKAEMPRIAELDLDGLRA